MNSAIENSSTPGTGLPVSRLALNLITLGRSHSFESMLDACQRHGINIVAPWLDHYAAIGAEKAAAELRARSMTVSTVCRIAGFGNAESTAQWQQALDEARRIIDDAAAMQAESITIIGGSLAPGSRQIEHSRERIKEGVHTVLPQARAAGVLLAIEPLHPMVAAERGAVNTIAQGLAMATELGDGVGLMIDTYNTWWDPELAASLAAAQGRIFGYQVSDWLVPTTDLAFDRGMPGDGIIDLPGYRALVGKAGFDGPVEIEILSHRWGAMNPDDVLATVVARLSVC